VLARGVVDAVDDQQKARNLRPAHAEVGCEGEVS
jgi:hypothetical protein